MATKLKVGIVGHKDQLVFTRGYAYVLREKSFVTQEFATIKEALDQKVDLLVVMAFMFDFIDDYQKLTNPPPAIWICHSSDESPDAATRVEITIKPWDLYEKAKELLKLE